MTAWCCASTGASTTIDACTRPRDLPPYRPLGIDLPASAETHHSAATWLAEAPADRDERRLALAVVLVSVALFAVAALWAKVQLPAVWAFIPIYESALVLCDLITAVLLFGQCRIARSRALLVLAGGYLFTAAATVAHALTFPGLFSATGLLGATPQTTAWIYMFWHGGFPLVVIAYVLLSGHPSDSMPAPGERMTGSVLLASALAIGATVAFTAWAVNDGLPPIMQGNRYTPTLIFVVSTVWGLSLLAMVVLWWRRRPFSVLDLWLAVVMCAWLFDVGLAAVFNAGRFDLGFYAGRVYGLLAASFVLVRLLLENSVLHAALQTTHAEERRRSAELQRVSQELAATNAELSATNHELQEQSRFKSEFLANMSHELRTPLNAVIGFSEMLKDGMAGVLTERQRTFAGHIYKGGHHLLALINDILDLSKIEAGKVDIALEPVALEASVNEALTMVSELARGRSVQVVPQFDGPLGSLQADRRRLKQIVLNLVTNGIKFTPPGGQVSVRIGPVDRVHAQSALPGPGPGLRMPLPAGDDTRFVEISVHDTGIGIAHDDIHKLFKPFTQLSNTVTRSVEGTGLGLVMVHRLAELHGGTVAVSSEPGQGSCFTVWLPWRDHGPALPEVRAAIKAPPAQPLALVVEDNGEAALLLTAQLETLGFAVRCVNSGEAALELVNQITPDLITLDILLPGMDGWQFLARLKTIPSWSEVPVVVVSVVADRSRGFTLGAALVLQKPIGRDALLHGLERLGLKPGAGREVTVLVVDDDPSAIELLATQLRQNRYAVLAAHGGRAGIELAQRHRPDLIALDLEMPDVNGFDVVEALRSSPDTARIPIVVVTSQNLSAADRSRLNGHISEIVGKSQFSAELFVGEVQRALTRRP
jgi:signal transduction histidine kinase/DNA-binding response OmpR family regulator